MSASSLADACPSCFPGDNPAVIPHTVDDDGKGALTAHYLCPICGTPWRCGWDRESAEWPVSREPRRFVPSEAAIRAAEHERQPQPTP